MSNVKVTQKNKGWLKRLMKKYDGGAEIAVGFPRASEAAAMQYPTGEKVIDVALKNEFGLGVPERSFLRTGGNEFAEDAKPLLIKAVKSVNAGGSFDDEANKIGLKAVAAIQQKINDISSPPNSEATIQRKGFNNPLIESGVMKQSITFKVR